MVTSSAHHGIYPWNEPYRRIRQSANPDKCYGEDTKIQILGCLNCIRPECNNCIEQDKKCHVKSSKRFEKRLRIKNQIVELRKEELTVTEICNRINISRTAYYNIIKEGV